MKKQLALSGIKALVVRGLAILAAYCFMFVSIKEYGAGAWGAFTIATTFGFILTQVVKLGYDGSFLVIAAENNAHSVSSNVNHALFYYALKKNALFGFFVSVLLFVCSGPLALHFFHNADLAPYFRLIALSLFPASFLLVISEGMKAYGYNLFHVIFQNTTIYLAAFFLLIPLILLAHLSNNLHSSLMPIIAYVSTVWLLFIFGLFSFKKRSGLPWFNKSLLQLDTLTLNRFHKLSINFFFTQLFIVIIGWADTILLGVFSNEETVGSYSVAVRFSFLVFMPHMTMASIIAPKLSSYYNSSSNTELKHALRSSYRLSIVATIGMIAFILLSSGFIISKMGLLYTHELSLTILLLCLGQLLNVIFGPNDTILQMLGHENIFMNSIGIAMVMNVLIDLFLIPQMGMIGAAIGNIIGLVTWNTFCSIYLRKKLGITSIAL